MDLLLPSSSKALISIVLGPGDRVKTLEKSPFLPDWRAVSVWLLEIITARFGLVVPEITRLGSETKISSSGLEISRKRLTGSLVTGL